MTETAIPTAPPASMRNSPGLGPMPDPIPRTEIIYPDSDGKPMADNTRQFRYIVTIQGGIAALFADRPDVFVAGDLLWYPVEGDNKIRAAPDTMVVFGRPPGDRGSYLQWREDNLPPQVVFEVMSTRQYRRRNDSQIPLLRAVRRGGNDPWGRPYQYASPGLKGEVDVFSFVADGVLGGEGKDAEIGNWQ